MLKLDVSLVSYLNQIFLYFTENASKRKTFEFHKLYKEECDDLDIKFVEVVTKNITFV